MTFPKSILLLFGLSMFATLMACGGGGSHHTPPAITVSVSAVSTPLAVNSSNPVTATTTDTAGVTWSVTCASTAGLCGTFSATQTTTGTATNYIAPPAPTSNVVITATSVTTNTISASTSPAITINGATLADGTYVFSLAGEDANSNYYVAGVFTIASGLITTGEQDFVDTHHDRSDQINGTTNGTGASTIAYNADGNLQITLVTCNGGNCGATDANVGVAGTETLNGTILPLSTTGRTFITEFDASASASGELDQQPAGAASALPANGYAFVLNGYDHPAIAGNLPAPLAVGGIINIDDIGGVVGSISGTGSIFDANDAGTPSPGQPFSPSSVQGLDTLGRVTFTLNTSLFSPITLAGYIVDSNRIQLVEVSDTYSGTLGGIAYSQGANNTGNFTAASAAGTYVVGVTGFDGNGVLQAVNQLTLVAGAGVTGFIDYNDLVNSSGVTAGVSPDPVTAAGYTVDTAGIGGASAGDVTIVGVTDTGATVNTNVQLYLDGNGHALAITMDATDVLAGVGFTQSGGGNFTATSFNGNYALDVTGDDGSNELEIDGVGPATATGGTIAGAVDLNWLGSAGPTYPATTVSGSFASASSGVFTGTVTGVDAQSCIIGGTCSTDNFSYYLIDATGDNIAIETDESQLTLGFFLQQ
jgi:hypothetical protein